MTEHRPSQIKDGGDAAAILIMEKGKKRQGELYTSQIIDLY